MVSNLIDAWPSHASLLRFFQRAPCSSVYTLTWSITAGRRRSMGAGVHGTTHAARFYLASEIARTGRVEIESTHFAYSATRAACGGPAREGTQDKGLPSRAKRRMRFPDTTVAVSLVQLKRSPATAREQASGRCASPPPPHSIALSVNGEERVCARPLLKRSAKLTARPSRTSDKSS